MFVQYKAKVHTILYELISVRTIIVRTLYDVCSTSHTNHWSCRRTFDELKDMIMDDSVVLNMRCWCFRCKTYCIRGPRDGNHTLELFLLGSPCTDASTEKTNIMFDCLCSDHVLIWFWFNPERYWLTDLRIGPYGGKHLESKGKPHFLFWHRVLDADSLVDCLVACSLEHCNAWCYIHSWFIVLRCKMMKQTRPRVVVHENVTQFPAEDMLGNVLGSFDELFLQFFLTHVSTS